MKLVLYDLLHELLDHNWRYFFKSNILMKMNNQPEQVENVQHFTAILQVRQYYINDNEQPARTGRKCPAVYSHSTGKAVLY